MVRLFSVREIKSCRYQTTTIKAYLAYSDSPDSFDYISNTAVTLLEGFLLRIKEKNGYTPKHISYNKDSDQWFCFMGNHTVSCKRTTRTARGKKEDILSYIFSKEQCVNCPHRDICMGKNRTKARKLQVALSTSLFYEKSQEQKKPEFLEKYKKAFCTGMEKRRNETLSRIVPSQRLGTAKHTLSSKINGDCGKSEKNCRDNRQGNPTRYRVFEEN